MRFSLIGAEDFIEAAISSSKKPSRALNNQSTDIFICTIDDTHRFNCATDIPSLDRR
jgi:hypothetical protein